MKPILRSVVYLLFALFARQTLGAESVAPWRWYYSAFGSPDLGAKVVMRSGLATVDRSKTAMKITLQESEGSTASFVGKILASEIAGQLVNFFPSGPESFNGTTKTLQIEACKFEQIALQSRIPDGGVLMVSRISGECK